jgi:chemotaxis response regulator CheB
MNAADVTPPADRVVVVAAPADGVAAVSLALGALPAGFPAALPVPACRGRRSRIAVAMHAA